MYVPSTTGLKPILTREHKNRTKNVENQLKKLFGGSTQVKGIGTWKSGNKTYREPVVIVETFTTESGWKKNDKKLKSYLDRKKKEWNQEVIAFEWEHMTKEYPFEGMHYV